MGWLGGALGAIGGITSLFAGNSLANAAQDAAKKGNDLISQYYGNAQSYLNPYANAGSTGLSALQNMVANPQQFNMSDFYSDPGYQFQLQQGNQAIQRSAAAKGGLTSGATGKALAQYTTNLANTTYGDAFNRYLQQNNQQYNQALGLANLGYGASSQQSGNAMNAGTSMANNLVNAITGAGNARASGYVGAGNAAGNTLAGLYSAYKPARPTFSGSPTYSEEWNY